jgi:hypothetical protein
MPISPSYDRSVFINCPFDQKYKPLLHAILFAVHDSGFVARIALEEVGGREARLAKICRLVEQSRWSVHDLSRVQLSRKGKLPRFNMPFECGLAYGAVSYGQQGKLRRDMLVMAAIPFQDKATISDLAGIDPAYHENSIPKLVAAVRRFLAAKSPVGTVRGAASIYRRLLQFEHRLPLAVKTISNSVSYREIKSFDYVNDWLHLATHWMRTNP